MARLQNFLCSVLAFQVLTAQQAYALPYGLDSIIDSLKSTAFNTRSLQKKSGAGAAVVSGNNTSVQQSVWILEDTYQGKTFFECVTFNLILLLLI